MFGGNAAMFFGCMDFSWVTYLFKDPNFRRENSNVIIFTWEKLTCFYVIFGAKIQISPFLQELLIQKFKFIFWLCTGMWNGEHEKASDGWTLKSSWTNHGSFQFWDRISTRGNTAAKVWKSPKMSHFTTLRAKRATFVFKVGTLIPPLLDHFWVQKRVPTSSKSCKMRLFRPVFNQCDTGKRSGSQQK